MVNAIERSVGLVAYDLPQLLDKDVIWVYSAYLDYFKAVDSGSDRPESTATAQHRDLLLEYIWEALLKREELQLDDPLVGGVAIEPTGQPVASLEQLYVLAFRWLRTSARNAREKGNPRAYLQLIEESAPADSLPEGFNTLAYVQVKYGVPVTAADRENTPTLLGDLHRIESPKVFPGASRGARPAPVTD